MAPSRLAWSPGLVRLTPPTVQAKVWLSLTWPLLTRTVTLWGVPLTAALARVPLMVPLLGSRLSPAGRPVAVKVSGRTRTLGGVQAHLAYIGRDGDLCVEVDQGFNLLGKGFEKQRVPDWNLDLLAHRRQDKRSFLGKLRSPKLVHNLIFSMPPSTPPKKCWLHESVS